MLKTHRIMFHVAAATIFTSNTCLLSNTSSFLTLMTQILPAVWFPLPVQYLFSTPWLLYIVDLQLSCVCVCVRECAQDTKPH